LSSRREGKAKTVPAFRTLLIPDLLYEEIIEQALTERPLECCGLLAGVIDGDVGRVTTRYPLVNELRSPVEYNAEPRGLLMAHKDMRARGIDVLAVYHSHPTTQPIPSKKDLAANYSEDVVSLIVSLAGEAPSVLGWWLTEREYREAEWDIRSTVD
jgi:proteasome lid subunit RPN8/RPN11